MSEMSETLMPRKKLVNRQNKTTEGMLWYEIAQGGTFCSFDTGTLAKQDYRAYAAV